MASRWLIRRVTFMVVVLFVALTINFILPRVMPGDPVTLLAGGAKLSAEARDALIVRFGLDRPIATQFVRYIVNAFKGDFGLSFWHYPRPVMDVILEALPWSLLVLIVSLVLQFLIGSFLGVNAAWKAGSKTDSTLQALSLAIWATPLFWMGMLFLYVFAFQLAWFPLSGTLTAGATYANPFEWLADVAKHAALPIIANTVNWYATYQLIMRNTMVAVLNEPYIVTAEAKGLSDSAVKYKHAARNALLPVVTVLGLQFGTAVGGSIFIETVFSYPGIGKLIFDSVISRDYPVLQGCFFIFSSVVVVANFLVDVVYSRLDPRVTY